MSYYSKLYERSKEEQQNTARRRRAAPTPHLCAVVTPKQLTQE